VAANIPQRKTAASQREERRGAGAAGPDIVPSVVAFPIQGGAMAFSKSDVYGRLKPWNDWMKAK
jgi:hypothetical protein